MNIQKLSNSDLIDELKGRLFDLSANHKDQEELLQELEQVNLKLQKSELMKSEFISNIKNELINPFTSILSLSESILNYKGALDGKIKDKARFIHEEAFKMDFQFRNIFAAAELEAGESIPMPATVRVLELLDGIQEYFLNEIRRKELSVVIDHKLKEIGDDIIVTDAVKLRLILSNILDNAVKFSPKGGAITISLGKEGDHLIIQVCDEGDGIQAEKQKEIFNRFEQQGTGSVLQQQGLGLGLTVSKACLDLIQGSIQIVNNIGKGGLIIQLILTPLSGQNPLEESSEGDDFLFEDVTLF